MICGSNLTPKILIDFSKWKIFSLVIFNVAEFSILLYLLCIILYGTCSNSVDINRKYVPGNESVASIASMDANSRLGKYCVGLTSTTNH